MRSEVKKKSTKKTKNRSNKINLVFDEKKRREFLTGFHKRKLQRKKQAKEQFEKDLKKEKKRIKAEAKESYKKLVVSHRPIPELQNLLEQEYEDENTTVKIIELSTADIAKQNNWIGSNQPKYSDQNEDELSDGNDFEAETQDEIPGMELKPKKLKAMNEKLEFASEREVKKQLKKTATKTVQKSKIFQKKNQLERQKQKKKSLKQKKIKDKFKSKLKSKVGGIRR